MTINVADPIPYRDHYRDHGFVQIPDFLSTDAALELRAYLRDNRKWTMVYNVGEKCVPVEQRIYEAFSPDHRHRIAERLALTAISGFQYHYDRILAFDDPAQRERADDPLNGFARLMASLPALELMRSICEAPDITTADAQASSYSSGHFLTVHNDAVVGQGRRAAYVLGLTPEWKADWGGLLLLHDEDDNIRRGLVPRFNTLNLFTVPLRHSVSRVVPAVPVPRLSVTGWFKTPLPAEQPEMHG